MVEKIDVSRKEVLYYRWLDYTWVYLHYTRNAVTQNPMFSEILVTLLCYGIEQITGKPYGDIVNGGGYLLIQYDTDEIIDILKNACDWLVKYVKVNDPTSPKGVFFEEHKAMYFSVLDETKKMIEEKNYKYSYKSVDGMN